MHYSIDSSPWPMLIGAFHANITKPEVNSYFQQLESEVALREGKFIPVIVLPNEYLSSEIRLLMGKRLNTFCQRFEGLFANLIIICPNTIAQIMVKGIMLSLDDRIPHTLCETMEEATMIGQMWIDREYSDTKPPTPAA